MPLVGMLKWSTWEQQGADVLIPTPTGMHISFVCHTYRKIVSSGGPRHGLIFGFLLEYSAFCSQ